MPEHTPWPRPLLPAPWPHTPDPHPQLRTPETHPLIWLEDFRLLMLQKPGLAVPTMEEDEAAENTSDVNVN